MRVHEDTSSVIDTGNCLRLILIGCGGKVKLSPHLLEMAGNKEGEIVSRRDDEGNIHLEFVETKYGVQVVLTDAEIADLKLMANKDSELSYEDYVRFDGIVCKVANGQRIRIS